MKIRILCFTLLVLGPLFAASQSVNNTSLVGTVTDSTGSVIVGAKVSAVNEDTGFKYDVVTNGQGYYLISGQIVPGTYDVTVDTAGFEKGLKKGVVVTLNEAARTDFTMKPGSETQEISVTANTPAIQTDDALLGETVPQVQVEDLPMNGRNVLDLANIASNVSVSTGSALTGVPPGKTANGAGTRGVNNSLTLDGITIMNNLGSTATVQPNADALESVQTQNGNYTAQYGDYLGVHINSDTKSGTNSFHGTAYDYLQNDDLNAKAFNRNTPVAPPKAELRYNLFGGVVSGPVIIPHFYNGHNRTFFLASYEGLRTHNTTPAYTQAFTPAEESGDFTALLNPVLSGGTKPVIIFSPIDGHSYYNPNTQTQIINDIPAANLPIVKNILKYAALCNVCTNPLNTNNLASPPSVTSENSSLERIDEQVGDKVRVFGRYDWQQVNYVSQAREYVNNNYNPTWARNFAAGVTYLITPNLVNDLRGGFNWLKTDSLDYFYEFGPNNPDAGLGLPAPYGVGQSFGDPGLPDIDGATSFSESESGDNWIQDDRTYQIYDQISWTKGRHSLMAGVDFRRLNIGRAAVNSARGILNFASSYTSDQSTAAIPVGGSSVCATTSSCSYGSADAALITGIMSGDTTPLDQVKEEVTQWRDGFFVQDSWQVMSKLTLDYGVRYELPQVPVSANGFARLMDPTYTFLIPTSTATTPTAYTPQVGLPLTGPNHADIGPRFGFAYRTTNKITVRGGGGIYYNSNHLNAYTLTSSNFPFAASVAYTSPAAGSQTNSNPYDTLSNPTAGAGALPIAGIPGTYVTAYSVANPLPSETMYQWNADVGYELWRNAGLEIQYLGSHSVHLDTNYYPNQPVLGAGNELLSVNARRPNQNFGQVRVADNIASAAYHGLTAVYRQRLFHGVSGQISYTWAHAQDESNDANSSGSCMIQGDCRADWGNSSLDIRQKIVWSFTYAVPVFAKSNFLVQETLGGWRVNGIITAATGAPFQVTSATDWANEGVPQSSTGGGPERLNWAHAPKMTCSKSQVFSEAYGVNSASCVDATAYAAPVRFTYGNAHRYDLHGPGSWSNNLSLFKDFKIYEKTVFQFRAEAFNALNHFNLGAPGNVAFNDTATCTAASNYPNNSCYFQGNLTPSSSSSAFGYPTVTGSPRTLQLAGKINF